MIASVAGDGLEGRMGVKEVMAGVGALVELRNGLEGVFNCAGPS